MYRGNYANVAVYGYICGVFVVNYMHLICFFYSKAFLDCRPYLYE